MGLINWFDAKIDAKTMDACDDELSILRIFIGEKPERAEHFAESFLEATNFVSNLFLIRGSDKYSYASAITIGMVDIESGSKADYSKDILSRRLDFQREDPVRGSAYKILATWLSLVDIRTTSKGGALRAHNLILAYETEVTRLFKAIKPSSREAVPVA